VTRAVGRSKHELVTPLEKTAMPSHDRGSGSRIRLTTFQKVKIAFLLAGFVSFLFSVYLWFFVDKEQGVFVGLWVPSVLALGALVLAGERDE
jgi:hypothetical protein